MNDSTRKLAANMKTVAGDVGAVVADTAEQSLDHLSRAGKKAYAALDGAQEAAQRSISHGAHVADDYVRGSPWVAIGAAAALAAAIGYLIGRR